jgi:hypothetical protein
MCTTRNFIAGDMSTTSSHVSLGWSVMCDSGEFDMKLLKTALVIGALVPLAAIATPVAAATLTFDWTLSGPSPSLGGVPSPGSGTITVTTGTGSDMITGITGDIGGDPITGLAPLGTLNGNDNLLFPVGTTFTGLPVTTSTSPYVSASDLDQHGFAVTTAAGTFDIFGAFVPNATDVTAGNDFDEIGATGFGVGTFALTATPLPAALPLFAGGLGMVGLLSRRKKRQAAAAPVAA